MSEFDLMKVMYKKIFKEEFDETFESKIKMQRMAYILKSMNLKIPYGFTWFKHGPMSVELYYKK